MNQDLEDLLELFVVELPDVFFYQGSELLRELTEQVNLLLEFILSHVSVALCIVADCLAWSQLVHQTLPVHVVLLEHSFPKRAAIHWLARLRSDLKRWLACLFQYLVVLLAWPPLNLELDLLVVFFSLAITSQGIPLLPLPLHLQPVGVFLRQSGAFVLGGLLLAALQLVVVLGIRKGLRSLCQLALPIIDLPRQIALRHRRLPRRAAEWLPR